jgi:beta-glucosidase
MSKTERRIDDLLAKMTLEEKIGQLNGLATNKPYEDLAEYARRGEMGSLCVDFFAFVGHEDKRYEYKSCMELQRIAVEESRLGIPIILIRDVIHGHRTVFPIPLAQAASWDESTVGPGL